MCKHQTPSAYISLTLKLQSEAILGQSTIVSSLLLKQSALKHSICFPPLLLFYLFPIQDDLQLWLLVLPIQCQEKHTPAKGKAGQTPPHRDEGRCTSSRVLLHLMSVWLLLVLKQNIARMEKSTDSPHLQVFNSVGKTCKIITTLPELWLCEWKTALSGSWHMTFQAQNCLSKNSEGGH